MKIVFKKSFVKQYSKLDKRHQDSVDTTIRLFEKSPHASQLKNHPLKGKLKGKRSISAGFDLRIVFRVEGDYVLVEMLGVGSHNQIY